MPSSERWVVCALEAWGQGHGSVGWRVAREEGGEGAAWERLLQGHEGTGEGEEGRWSCQKHCLCK